MSDLRDEIARAIRESDDNPTSLDLTLAEQYVMNADAVLRVVGEALLRDEAVHANRRCFEGWNTVSNAGVDSSRRGLSAAWRVVTGSKEDA